METRNEFYFYSQRKFDICYKYTKIILLFQEINEVWIGKHIAHSIQEEEGSNNTNSNRSDHKQSKAKKFFLFYFYFIPRGSTSAK